MYKILCLQKGNTALDIMKDKDDGRRRRWSRRRDDEGVSGCFLCTQHSYL